MEAQYKGHTIYKVPTGYKIATIHGLFSTLERATDIIDRQKK